MLRLYCLLYPNRVEIFRASFPRALKRRAEDELRFSRPARPTRPLSFFPILAVWNFRTTGSSLWISKVVLGHLRRKIPPRNFLNLELFRDGIANGGGRRGLGFLDSTRFSEQFLGSGRECAFPWIFRTLHGIFRDFTHDTKNVYCFLIIYWKFYYKNSYYIINVIGNIKFMGWGKKRVTRIVCRFFDGSCLLGGELEMALFRIFRASRALFRRFSFDKGRFNYPPGK